MNKIHLRVAKSLLFRLSLLADCLARFSNESIFKINKKIIKPELRERLDELFKESNIINQAKEYRDSSNFSNEEKELAYYFYLLKHFTAEHGTRFGTIPIQVYNEHRMALDHFMRAKSKDRENNIKKATAHLCRALLDVLKLNCAGLRDEIDKRHDTIPYKALGLISNGKYVQEFISWQQQAEDELNSAKYEEYKLGNDIDENLNVAELFVRAFLAHNEWYKFQRENLGNAIFIKAKYYSIKGLSIALTFLLGVAATLVVTYFNSLIEFLKNFHR